MNKNLQIFIGLALLVTCRGEEWYSTLNKVDLAKYDIEFFEKNSHVNGALLKSLQDFRQFLVKRDFVSLYHLRSDEYQKTVSFENFSNSIFGKTEIPVRVYHTLVGSSVNQSNAEIKSYYVMSNRKFETCTETTDYWNFDKKRSRWIFVKNDLPWGSPVVIEKQMGSE